MRRHTPPVDRRARRGFALLAALALLALAAALLAGAFASAMASVRATRSAGAIARADAGGRRTVADFVARFGGAVDSLPPGASLERAISTGPPDARPPLTGTVRVSRLGSHLVVVSVDARIGEGRARLARRRYRLILDWPEIGDSSAQGGVPRIISRWGFSELY